MHIRVPGRLIKRAVNGEAPGTGGIILSPEPASGMRQLAGTMCFVPLSRFRTGGLTPHRSPVQHAAENVTFEGARYNERIEHCKIKGIHQS